jgi:hypothetical protein
MPKVKLLTVTCENRPGTLSYVARVLGDAKVNILAFHCLGQQWETCGLSAKTQKVYKQGWRCGSQTHHGHDAENSWSPQSTRIAGGIRS